MASRSALPPGDRFSSRKRKSRASMAAQREGRFPGFPFSGGSRPRASETPRLIGDGAFVGVHAAGGFQHDAFRIPARGGGPPAEVPVRSPRENRGGSGWRLTAGEFRREARDRT